MEFGLYQEEPKGWWAETLLATNILSIRKPWRLWVTALVVMGGSVSVLGAPHCLRPKATPLFWHPSSPSCLQVPRSPGPSPLPCPNPTSPHSGKPAFGKGLLAQLGWPRSLRISALRSRARSWTMCGQTHTTWGCSSQIGECVEVEGRGGGGARGLGDAHHPHSLGLTPTPCNGSMQPGGPGSSCRWRTRTSTVPTVPRAMPR